MVGQLKQLKADKRALPMALPATCAMINRILSTDSCAHDSMQLCGSLKGTSAPERPQASAVPSFEPPVTYDIIRVPNTINKTNSESHRRILIATSVH